MDEQSPTPEEADILLDVTRWHKEQARSTEDSPPDYDEETVTHILEDRPDAEFVEWLPGPPERDTMVARFRVTDVTSDGETVDYSVEISESLVQRAAEAHPHL